MKCFNLLLGGSQNQKLLFAFKRGPPNIERQTRQTVLVDFLIELKNLRSNEFCKTVYV